MGIYRVPATAANAVDSKMMSPIIANLIPQEVVNGSLYGRGFGITEQMIKLPDSTTAWSGYTVTNTNGTLVDAQEEGGALTFTVAGGDNDLIQVQAAEAFYVDADTMIAGECRVKAVDVLQQDLFFGLSITDTSIGATAPSDAIGIGLADGSANIVYLVTKNSAGSYTDTGADAADATYVRLGMVVDGESSVKFYVDGVLVSTVTSGLPNDEVLALSVSNMAGEGAANNATFSYWYMYQWLK